MSLSDNRNGERDAASAAPPEFFNFTRDVIGRWARERPHATALWWVDASGRESERQYTWHDLADEATLTASFFHALGLRRGDRVLVVLPRVPEWWLAVLGLIELGAVPIPGTTLLTEKDLAYRIGAAEVRGIVADQEIARRVPQDFAGVRVAACSTESTPPGWHNLAEAAVRGRLDFDAGPPTRADDDGILYFTSGTTGPPKMVLHTQASCALGHRVTGALWLDLKPDDVHWNLADNGWAKAAWSSLFGPWHQGACLFVWDTRGKFDPAATLRTLAAYPITTWCAPPTALRLIVREDLGAYVFPNLRHCVSAGEPLNPEVIELWRAATGLTIHDGYGQTETVVLVANFPASGKPIRPGAMGWPTPGYDVRVLDAHLRECPPGQTGEVAVRVQPQRPVGIFKEYWKNPQENAARFQGDWYLTGDVALRDADGWFWFVGRGDDVIKSSGYRIGPFEVESALIEHPAVLEAAVVGRPDAERGALVVAFVVLRRGHAGSPALAAELQAHCKQVTAPYKYPREIVFVEALPKTISGKIRRVELREQAAKRV
ncbi:MAG: AMP-binding protein [Verrucomicrobia bacterium]|nr:AMP-binding protein [Verrucomicrobiota bacterium]